jgi:hypothetical protein
MSVNNIYAQLVTVGYRLGGAQDGAANFSGSATAVQCLVRSIKRDVSYDKVDLKGLCATEKQQQVTSKSGTIEVEFFVDKTAGPVFQSSIGYYIEITFTPASGITAIVDTGVIEKVGLSVDVDGALMEPVSIMLGVNGV